MIMDIIFLGSFFPKEIESDITKNSIGAIANANNALQLSIVSGLSSFDTCELEMLNMPAIGAYPSKYKKWVFHSGFFSVNKKKGINIGFLNLLGIKHFCKYYQIKKVLSHCLQEHTKDVCFIVYDLYWPYLQALNVLKKKNPHIKICLIVPDLVGFTGTPRGFLYNLLIKYNQRLVNKNLIVADGFVLLSKHMKERLPVGNKPYIVMEGIFNPRDAEDVSVQTQNNQLKVIFYSGAIDERNGVLELLKAFSMIADSSYRLVICGDGYERDRVLLAAEKDDRIIFKGQISRKEVLRLQRESTLLVNPRPSFGDFTKYSFPSKTMEYFVSGVPVLMYRLEGVPEEYYNYCFSIDEHAILADTIVHICSLDLEILKKKGESAKNFILKNKTPKKQTVRIVDMLKNEL